MANYWSTVTQQRLSRRRALIAGSALSAGLAVTLIGCGGGGGSETKAPAAGLISQPVDTSAQAKRGGILQQTSAELQTFDSLPAPSGGSSAGAASHVYSRLLKFKTGVVKPALGELEPDLAASYEVSADKLQIIFKLRPEAKLDPRAPTNGRAVEAKDVLYSANKFEKLSTFGPDMFASFGGLGPIESFTAPDARTVVVKLARPDSLALQLLANPRYLWIYPTESDGGFDPRIEARGSGPWRMKSFNQSQGIEYERNPDWHGLKGGPYLDGIRTAFITEYATLFSQFRAKTLWIGDFLKNEDLVPLKNDFPELLLYTGQYPRAGTRFWFGKLPTDTPFRDERVRQATSMALDRDLFIDVFDGADQLQAQGIPVEKRWHSHLGAGWEGAWLDPKGKDFGPNGKYFNYDLAEVKKLLTAAGHPNGFTYDFHYTNNSYGDAYQKLAQVLTGELNKAGITAKMSPEDYATVFLSGSRSAGMFTGARIVGSSIQGSPLETVSLHHHSKGGFGVNQPPYNPEPDIDAKIDAMRKEFDAQKLTTMLQDLQRDLAGRMRAPIYVPSGGSGGGIPALTMAWPWLGNYGAHTVYIGGGPTEAVPYYWYDASKKGA